MSNPFLSFSKEDNCEYLSPICSLNKGVVAELPIKGIDDSILGKSFKDIFSTPLIIGEIKNLAKIYSVDISRYEDSTLPKLLDLALVSDDIKIRQLSQRVATKFGNRLGLLFLTLRLAQNENRATRADWNDEHWAYWKNLKYLVLVGGLASGILGRRFKEQIQYVFDMAGAKPYNIVLFDNGTYVGVMGCASKLQKDDSTGLVFDLGHTNIKRCVVSKSMGEISEFIPLESAESLYMDCNNTDSDAMRQEALELHKYLLKVIVETYKEQIAMHSLNDEILISIASYTKGGVLNDTRGGYAKLSTLGKNYAKVLTEDLSSMLHKNVSVRLVHDGTANALYFSDYENSVCVSLGTAFGVGFPDINI